MMSLVGAAAVAASILLVRQQRRLTLPEIVDVDSPDEPAEKPISLERLRELGI